MLRLDTQEFNQKFWLRHNSEFKKGREAFVKKILAEKYPNEEKHKTTVDASEMSIFYKSFLDAQWKAHLDYNYEWQKRNFAIMFLALRVKIENLFRH